MKIRLSQSEFCLSKNQTLSLAGATGVRVDARSGALWLTQDDDSRDIVLREGDSFTLDGKGRAIVQAFEPSFVVLSPPVPAPRLPAGPGLARRVGRALQRSMPLPAWA